MSINVTIEPSKPYQGGPETLTGFTVRASVEGLMTSFPIPLQEAPAIVAGMMAAIRDYQVATAAKLRAAADMTTAMREAADTLALQPEEVA